MRVSLFFSFSSENLLDESHSVCFFLHFKPMSYCIVVQLTLEHKSFIGNSCHRHERECEWGEAVSWTSLGRRGHSEANADQG